MIIGTTKMDIFDFARTRVNAPCAIVITTNTMLRKDGLTGVMGAGIAKQARDLVPNAETTLGTIIRTYGESVGELGCIEGKIANTPITLLAFPTKRDFRNPSDLDLIRQSAMQLNFWANQHPDVKYILMPPVGCGLGGLDWNSQVAPAIAPILASKRFYAIFRV